MRAISAISGRSKRTAVLVFAVLIGLALVGWAAARQIRSPAQVAADTAAPKPSPITVPVVSRTLSTEVRFARRNAGDLGASRPAELALQLLSAALPALAGALLLARTG